MDFSKCAAQFCVETGYKNTDNGNYIVSYEEVAVHFGKSVNFVKSYAGEIAMFIDLDERVNSPTWLVDDGFDMNFYFEEENND